MIATTDSTPNNVSGWITDPTLTNYSASQLFIGHLYGNTGFTSTFWAFPFGESYIFDLGFGIDSSLTAGPGWDSATGWGTPYGLAFINATAAYPY